MRSVGVIGGLGPETTAQFYLEVIFQCQKINKEQRPSIIISNVPLLFEIEHDLIALNKGIERYTPFLVKEAKRLEKSGVDFLVMPCNSLHVFINEIRASVSIPVVSIVDETVNYIKKAGFNKVGFISTAATIANKVYETQFDEANITYVTPSDDSATNINAIIQRLVNGQHLIQDRIYLESIAMDLSNIGADAIALACTDLQLLLPINSSKPVFDTMKILAEAAVREIVA